MKIFITGATGFIGKHLVKKLKDEGHVVIINLRANRDSPFDNSIDTYNIEKYNEENIKWFIQQKFDGVIHLASLYITNHKSGDIDDLINSNVKFGSIILEIAAKANVKWFINTGTFWQHYQNKQYSPVNLYAATKQAFESIAQYYIETNQIFLNTIKLSDTFGPDDTRPKIFNLWEKAARTGEKMAMSPGYQVIDINYVEDVVNAFIDLAVLLNKKVNHLNNGQSFAVKAIKRYTLRELASIYEKVMNCKLNINWGEKTYREREVMCPWENGKLVPGWTVKGTLEDNIKKL